MLAGRKLLTFGCNFRGSIRRGCVYRFKSACPFRNAAGRTVSWAALIWLCKIDHALEKLIPCRLQPAWGPHTAARLRFNARGCDGGVR